MAGLLNPSPGLLTAELSISYRGEKHVFSYQQSTTDTILNLKMRLDPDNGEQVKLLSKGKQLSNDALLKSLFFNEPKKLKHKLMALSMNAQEIEVSHAASDASSKLCKQQVVRVLHVLHSKQGNLRDERHSKPAVAAVAAGPCSIVCMAHVCMAHVCMAHSSLCPPLSLVRPHRLPPLFTHPPICRTTR